MTSLRVGLVTLAALGHASADPMRALPQPSDRAPASGPIYHVDAKAGDDAGDGSAHKPYKTIARAVKRLRPGDTLYLHNGVYFEAVALSVAGTAAAPITIRSAPGELAVIDGGLREFVESPSTAWEPVKGGAGREFQSVSTYPALHKETEQ